MLKNRNATKYNLKTHIDIYNYNKFLLTLDTLSVKPINTPLNDNVCNNPGCNNPGCNKQYLNAHINKMNNEYTNNHYDNTFFTGTSYNPQNTLSMQVLINHEPNASIPLKPINNIINNPKTKVIICEEPMNTVADLLELIKKYQNDETIEYNINMDLLHKIKVPLTELHNMIGMKILKENILEQLLFYIQNLHMNNSTITPQYNDFMHTVIYGPPGTGKTEVAKIIGSIFAKMGILSKGTFKKVTRSDLIAGYLGQTAIKTKEVIKDSLGGVLFIDEAYALGNEDKKDSFSKECIDTLCEAMSDHKDNLMVIIAGYETDLNSCFFNYNQGLKSRFTWRFKTDEYTAINLYDIFIKKVNDGGWTIAFDSGINVKWFEKNKSYFKSYGRDIETLFAKTKIAHSRRVFYLDETYKKKLTIIDINKGFETFLKHEDAQQKEKDKLNAILSSMYI